MANILCIKLYNQTAQALRLTVGINNRENIEIKIHFSFFNQNTGRKSL